jgi:hypothetical protein
MNATHLSVALLLSATVASGAAASPFPATMQGRAVSKLGPLRSGAQAAAPKISPSVAPLSGPPVAYNVFDAPGAGAGSGQGTFGTGINSLSGSCGYYIDDSDNWHGYLLAPDGTTFTTFDVDGSNSQTDVAWMNAKGVVTGEYVDPDTGITEGFLRTASGEIQTFDGAGGGSAGTFVDTVSNSSTAVGFYWSPSNVYHGFYRTRKGALVQFDAPNAGTQINTGTDAFDINNADSAVGVYWDNSGAGHAFLRTADGTFTEFDAPGAGFDGTIGSTINNQGSIAGSYYDSNHALHGYVRDPSGNITEFDAPDAGTGHDQGTWVVDNHTGNRILGWYIDSANVVHGFVRTRNGEITEFDAPNAGAGAGQGTFAFDNNRPEAIVGWEVDNDGVSHGFVRTP